MERSALPSMVSVMKEKTVSYLKCYSRGFEKVIWPIACIAILVSSILLIAVSCGTPNWAQLDIFSNASEPRGRITFGLLRGSHSINYGESPLLDTIDDSYFLFDKLPLSYLARILVTFGLSMVAILLCCLAIVITLLNSYQSVTTWWRGPSMMYLLSLFASVCCFTALGVFLDHYLWELNSDFIFTSTTRLSEEDALLVGGQTNLFEYLLTEQGYRSAPVLHYSFYLEVAGAALPLLVTLLAWRLALLIPAGKHKPVNEKQESRINYQLKERGGLQFFSPEGPVTTENPLLYDQSSMGPQMTSTFSATPTERKSISISPETQTEIFY